LKLVITCQKDFTFGVTTQLPWKGVFKKMVQPFFLNTPATRGPSSYLLETDIGRDSRVSVFKLLSGTLIISIWNCQIKRLNCQKLPIANEAHDESERFQVETCAISIGTRFLAGTAFLVYFRAYIDPVPR
jgi:hypothetical protein